MSECTRHDPEQEAMLKEMSDDALIAYAGIHVSTDSDALIIALVERVQVIKQDNETGYW